MGLHYINRGGGLISDGKKRLRITEHEKKLASNGNHYECLTIEVVEGEDSGRSLRKCLFDVYNNPQGDKDLDEILDTFGLKEMDDFDEICNKDFYADVYTKETKPDSEGKIKKRNDLHNYYEPIEQPSIEEQASDLHKEQVKEAVENSEDQKDDDVPF